MVFGGSDRGFNGVWWFGEVQWFLMAWIVVWRSLDSGF